MEAKQDKPQIQLSPGSLQQLDQVSVRYDAEVPMGVDQKDLLKPEFWAHHAARLRPWDEIRARCVDGTWLATYVVLDASRTWARVQQMSFHRLTTGDQAATQASEQDVKAFKEAHRVDYRGPLKFSIVRKSDGAILEENIGTKAAALTKLDTIAREHTGGALDQQAVTA